MARDLFSTTNEQAFNRVVVVGAEESRWGEPTSTSADHVWTKISRRDTADVVDV